jgi:4-hydroxy-tetrahydrodipicolinate synthase
MNKFTGTGVALITPFNKDLSIDYEGLKKLIQHVSNSVDYLVIHGTTGESATTTLKRKTKFLPMLLKRTRKSFL